jgi:putative addiction module component (TIGR02574 family)
MTTAERLLQEAMQLSSDERELLAIELFATLEKEPGYDEAWETEIERRIKEVDDGTVETIPWSEVRKRMSERVRGRTRA